MLWIKRILVVTLVLAAVTYVGICGFLWFGQEKLIFHPHPLPADYQFAYGGKYTEVFIPGFDGKKLHGLLFKADTTRGLVFYLHGNAGALDTWGDIAGIYTAMGYDIFITDYRGFGKSEGEIFSQEQVFKDAQAAYDMMKKNYPENSIVVIGYSIGTGPAARIASVNKPKQLILQAPYYSLTDLGEKMYPSITPRFLLRYKFDTYRYLKQTKAPVAIFHGDADNVIYYGSALKLQKQFKPGDTLVTLAGVGHGQLNQNQQYQQVLKSLLDK
ncbi:MAG TPA: alpha/beta hydrolase [Chitinophagales bacterium]|nr:alpha/beta hydrolase [Chitinophagales bacterium]